MLPSQRERFNSTPRQCDWRRLRAEALQDPHGGAPLAPGCWFMEPWTLPRQRKGMSSWCITQGYQLCCLIVMPWGAGGTLGHPRCWQEARCWAHAATAPPQTRSRRERSEDFPGFGASGQTSNSLAGLRSHLQLYRAVWKEMCVSGRGREGKSGGTCFYELWKLVQILEEFWGEA